MAMESHLGHVTRTIWTNFRCRVLRSLNMKFEFNWPIGPVVLEEKNVDGWTPEWLVYYKLINYPSAKMSLKDKGMKLFVTDIVIGTYRPNEIYSVPNWGVWSWLVFSRWLFGWKYDPVYLMYSCILITTSIFSCIFNNQPDSNVQLIIQQYIKPPASA